MAKQKTQKESAKEFTFPVGIVEAAQYCGLSVAALKYHIYVSMQLQGRSIGHSLVFERDALDTFLANKRSVGRPALEQATTTV